VPLKTRLAQSY